MVPIAPSQSTVPPANNLPIAPYPATEPAFASSNTSAMIVSTNFFHPKPPPTRAPNAAPKQPDSKGLGPDSLGFLCYTRHRAAEAKTRRNAQVGVSHR